MCCSCNTLNYRNAFICCIMRPIMQNTAKKNCILPTNFTTPQFSLSPHSPNVKFFVNVTLLHTSLHCAPSLSLGCGRRPLCKTQFASYFVPYRSPYHLECVHNRTLVLFAQVLINSANCLCILFNLLLVCCGQWQFIFAFTDQQKAISCRQSAWRSIVWIYSAFRHVRLCFESV